MKDVQRTRDRRGIHIDQVGVSDLRYPITVLDLENKEQHTVGTFALSVDLPHHFKGTHMSRFVEVLNEYHGEITARTIPAMLRKLHNRLEAQKAHILVEFPYFIVKAAPVSGAKASVDVNCAFIAESDGKNMDFLLRVEVPVTSLCPCSKEISDYGAHNQRGKVTFTIRSKRDRKGAFQLIWIEELMAVAERSASAPIYALLKRVDERHVTMQAFENPVFVEDMVRNAGAILRADKRIAWFEVRAVNHESIHNHSAFAVVSSLNAKRRVKG
ncbi:MAG: GTP cyclohydrolase FolE2 [bacterium]|nr:GTP cyclohydrolase FolE2 [bacterium]